MSQEKLAKELGVTFQQVQKYEKGINRISAGRLHHAAQILDTPISFFFPEEGRRNSPALDVMESLTQPEGIELMTAFARVKGPRMRRQIIALVHEIAQQK